ncbi:hypothetical protein V9N52_004362 [Vibrio navarrensis]
MDDLLEEIDLRLNNVEKTTEDFKYKNGYLIIRKCEDKTLALKSLIIFIVSKSIFINELRSVLKRENTNNTQAGIADNAKNPEKDRFWGGGFADL